MSNGFCTRYSMALLLVLSFPAQSQSIDFSTKTTSGVSPNPDSQQTAESVTPVNTVVAHSANLVSTTAPPILSADSQVSWSFDAISSELTIEVTPFATMPLASNGRPARWNDLEYQGNRLFVSDEQDGKIMEITGGNPTEWFNVANAIKANTGRSLNISNAFHGGLRGFAFHPDYAENGKFYTSVMEDRPEDTTQHVYLSDAATTEADSVLLEWTSINGKPDIYSYREVFRVGVPNFDHPIKQIAFNPSATPGSEDYGLLYIAHGDGSVESSFTGSGQNSNALGKIIRIDPLQYGDSPFRIPDTNPFTTNTHMPPYVYSYGHRNPHHLAFTKRGLLLTADAGRDNIDEINLVRAGADYGWSKREGGYVQLPAGKLFDGIKPLPDNDILNDYTYPVIQFGHTGTRGATVTNQALGGGFTVENGSPLDSLYFYIDFVVSGRLYYSYMSDIVAATTKGDATVLTVAQSYIPKVVFDHDSDASTEPLNMTLADIIKSADGFINTKDRVDIRIGQDNDGALYLMSKRNNMIYLVVSSQP